MTTTPTAGPGRESEALLGQSYLVADPTLPAHLTRVEGPHGSCVLKQHSQRERYEQERDAYRQWVPTVAEIAPTLLAADDAQMTILVSSIDGRTADTIEPGSKAQGDIYRAAGLVLRRLHSAPLPESSIPRVNADLARRLRGWISRAANLLSPSELHLLARSAEIMAATPMEAAVCHLDFQPRNWLVGTDGRITVIDFEHTRIDARVRDLARLAHRQWVENPGLKEAFLDGYGPLTDDDEQLLSEFGALEAVTALVRGTELQDATLAGHGRAALARLAESAR